MFRHPSIFRPPSAGERDWRQPPPPQQPYPQPLNPNFSLQNQNQNPTNSSYIYPQNPAFAPNLAHNPNFPNFIFQNPNFPIQTPSFPLQNPIFNPLQLPNPTFQPQTSSENPKPNVDPQQLPNSAFRPQTSCENLKEMLERIDRAVEKARGDFVAAGRSVSAWKVLQSALVTLKVDDWSFLLGLQMHQVPSLHRLMLTEGRISSFIHCFVLARRITSLYDLELAICKNEDIEEFEVLGLGPLFRHPLVLHYFPVSSDTTEVFKITSEEILCLLTLYQEHKRKVSVEEFLDYIVKRRSVASKENIGIRICSLGVHVSSIRKGRKLERAALIKSQEQVRMRRYKKKAPNLTSLNEQLDKHFCDISQHAELFSVVQKEFCGKKDRFVSSSSKDGSGQDFLHEDDKDKGHACTEVNFSLQSAKISDQVSNSTYVSAIEERPLLGSNHPSPACGTQKHNEGNGSVKKKRKYENLSSPISVPQKLRKRDKVEQDVLFTKNDHETEEDSSMIKTDLSVSNDFLRKFITTWKDACKEQTVTEVLWSMLQCYDKRAKKISRMFASDPLIGLLNVAVSSIKCGMWDSMYDTSQSIGQHKLSRTSTDKYSEYLNTDVEPIIKDALPVITEHVTQHTQSE
ncbi:hypothetical protein ACFXTH_031621 [Malus domestica]